jgi:hypothetical protein
MLLSLLSSRPFSDCALHQDSSIQAAPHERRVPPDPSSVKDMRFFLGEATSFLTVAAHRLGVFQPSSHFRHIAW